MVVFDKGSWQLDGGIGADFVIEHFKFIFKWLDEYGLLSEYGKKYLNDGIDEYAALTEEMVNYSGMLFLSKYYDLYISQIAYGEGENAELLKEMYYRI